MILKTDFVTNSSSTSFIIVNRTSKSKTLVDFVKENPQLLQEFIEKYCYDSEEEKKKFNLKNLLKSAKENNINFKPHESKTCVFGDEQNTLIGSIFDYILRDGGKSKSFTWYLDKYLR